MKRRRRSWPWSGHWWLPGATPKCSRGSFTACTDLTITAGSIYLDWASGCWRLLPVAEEPDPEKVFANWIDGLKESEDREQLEAIASDINAALKSLPKEQPEPD